MAFNYNSSDFVNQAIADQGSSYLIIQGIPHVSGTSDYNIATNALRNVNYLSDVKDAQAIDLNNDSSEIELKKNTRITGDLTVVGQQTSIGCTALYIADNTIKIASNNNADLIDGSVYMQFNDGGILGSLDGCVTIMMVILNSSIRLQNRLILFLIILLLTFMWVD